MAETKARGVRVAERGRSRGRRTIGTLSSTKSRVAYISLFPLRLLSYGSVSLLLDPDLDLPQRLPRSAFSVSKMSDRPLLDDAQPAQSDARPSTDTSRQLVPATDRAHRFLNTSPRRRREERDVGVSFAPAVL